MGSCVGEFCISSDDFGSRTQQVEDETLFTVYV